MSTGMTAHKEDVRFVKEVLAYYTKHKRDSLPWRKNITPYKILVSEIMLQQTQVSRVIPKFLLWMKKYPSLKKLRESNLQDVLILWQGLGYQRRAKALLAIAQKVNSTPKSFEELLVLPGLGKYTASAVCAFGYNKFSHPLLETNIRTALIEYFHQDKEQVHDGVLYNDLARLEQVPTVKELGARAWYYALMDFGAHLKEQKISHNAKSLHYIKQTPYKGSVRELRAKTLFAITHGNKLPADERLTAVLTQLEKEGYLIKKRGKYFLEKN